jgi:hypothetical protein
MHQIERTPVPGLIGVADPDAPLFRIFTRPALEEVLRSRRLALVAPSRWPDPLDDLASGAVLVGGPDSDSRRTPLKPYLRPIYGQCWSAIESDTLLRAYSRIDRDPRTGRLQQPECEGVQVRSTARKLLAAARRWTDDSRRLQAFVGAVRYGTRGEVAAELASLIGQHGPEAAGRGELRARTALLKRRAFQHEAEVRLLCVFDEAECPNEVMKMTVDPSEMVEEISFDPRLDPAEREDRERHVRALGYTGAVRRSELYDETALEIEWPSGSR